MCLKCDNIKPHTYLCVLNECLEEYYIFDDNITEHHYYTKLELMEKVNKYNNYDNYNITITDELIMFMNEINKLLTNDFITEELLNDSNRPPYYKLYPPSLFEFINARAYNNICLCHPVLFTNDHQRFIINLINAIPEFLQSELTYDEYINEHFEKIGNKCVFKYVFNKAYVEYICYMDSTVVDFPMLVYIYNDINDIHKEGNIRAHEKLRQEYAFRKIYDHKIDINNLYIVDTNNIDYPPDISTIIFTNSAYRILIDENSITKYVDDNLNTMMTDIGYLDYVFLFNYLIFANDIPTLKTLLLTKEFNADFSFNHHIILTPEAYRLIQQTRPREELIKMLSISQNTELINYFNENNAENQNEIIKIVNYYNSSSWRRFNNYGPCKLFDEFLYNSLLNNVFNSRVIQALYTIIGYNKLPTFENSLMKLNRSFRYNNIVIKMLNEEHLGKWYEKIINYALFNGNHPIELLRFARNTKYNPHKNNYHNLCDKLENIEILISEYGLYFDNIYTLLDRYIKVHRLDTDEIIKMVMDKYGSTYCYDNVSIIERGDTLT